MYEMATGRRPFQGNTPFEAAMRRLRNPPESPRRLVPDLDPRWERAILHCLSRRPEDRFQSTSELLPALAPRKTKRSWQTWLLIGGIAALAIAIPATIQQSRRAQLPAAAPWRQLTNFSDSVTDPALSPDGHMLAFKRGGTWFMNPGQIYVKLLPDGQPVQLTYDFFAKMAPVFSPDGASVAYSVRRPESPDWEMWQAPVLPAGGEPRRLLSNAEGLTWIDKQHILFSEVKGPGQVMSVATATENRTALRDVYVPANRPWMAHFSALSPDRKKVLIVEMNPAGGGNFDRFRCRLVPFDGSSRGRLVGPGPDRPCIAAVWSPDGNWMYFSARTGAKFHLWRERAAGGRPEQITFGPTEEEGLTLSPDGRSAITSVGVYETTIWIHDEKGERQISGEGSAVLPIFSPDGSGVYYLSRPNLWRTDLRSEQPERVLPGVAVNDYALSRDGKAIAYVTKDGSLWYAPIDRRMATLRLAARGKWPQFTGGGDVLFWISSALYRIHPDGTDLRSVPGNPGSLYPPVPSLSPDEHWRIRHIGEALTFAEPLAGGRAVPLCHGCTVHWSLDGKLFWMSLRVLNGEPVTGLFRLKKGTIFPPLPRMGIQTSEELMGLPGVQIISSEIVSPAPDGSRYAFIKEESHWNLYRIPLP